MLQTGTLASIYQKDIQSRDDWRKSLIVTFEKLQNLGAEGTPDIEDTKYIKVSNFMAMVLLAGTAMYMMLALSWGKYLWLLSLTGLASVGAIVLLLNSMRYTHTSRVFFMIGSNIFLFISALLSGPGARGDSFLIITIMIPFLIFNGRHKKTIIAGTVSPIILVSVFMLICPIFEPFALSHDQQSLVMMASKYTEYFFILAAVLQFVNFSRKAEEDLHLSNMLLAEQTHELKRSNNDLEQFAYVVSHDLKAPVRNISSFINLLHSRHAHNLSGEAREFIDHTVTGAKRIEKLIDDILSYSKIGRNLPETSAVSSQEVITVIQQELEVWLKDINGGIMIASPLPIIEHVHTSLLYHVFQNLIRNGLKFNKSITPTVSISCKDTQDQYIFSIADNGIGIDKQYEQLVFQMFKRLHTDGEFEGTGIGLAICQKIAEFYRGRIWFESISGMGTTFFFSIKK